MSAQRYNDPDFGDHFRETITILMNGGPKFGALCLEFFVGQIRKIKGNIVRSRYVATTSVCSVKFSTVKKSHARTLKKLVQ